MYNDRGRRLRPLLPRRVAGPVQLAADTWVCFVRQPAIDTDDPEQRIRRVGTRALRIGDVITGGRRRAAAHRDDQHHNDNERQRHHRYPSRSVAGTAGRRHLRQATTRLGTRGGRRRQLPRAPRSVALAAEFNRLRAGLTGLRSRRSPALARRPTSGQAPGAWMRVGSSPAVAIGDATPRRR